MDNLQEKFNKLLAEIFQFDSSDLDFGVYRILNSKRSLIQKFINEDLKDKVETAFERHKDERLSSINERFKEKKEEIIKDLGENAFKSTGDLKEEFRNTPIGREFLSIKAQKEEAEKIDEIKNQVFNDLYNFFSRYYEEGDFVPQYRYSIKGHKYAIPYNGEEVKLYWANQDQYYIKTGLLFRDYTFKAGDYKVIFRIVSAKEELGSNKATKERFFILDDENPITFENKTIFIRFQYRELTEEEVKIYDVESGSNTSKQEKINQKSYDEILKGIKDITLKVILSKDYKNEKPLLLYQINRFTAKNTKDYFIHKNLKKFLSEQLDYFIKSEVLDIETIEKERFLDKHITRAKVVKEIGEDIIDFLSQIEDFQKRLWEKKKFVIKTEYVITLDKIKEYAGEDFLNEVIEEVLKNEGQLNEWRELGFGEIKSKDDLLLKNNLLEKTYKKLPIDTKYFSEDFKEKLLEKLTEKHDLDDILDGLLIKSENWQALNLILNKYKEKVQTIYIDPPYNTGSDEFLYRDRYQHSSWYTMMHNRLELSSKLLRFDGNIFISIDENEKWLLKVIGSEFFEFLRELIWESGAPLRFKATTTIWPRIHETILHFRKSSQSQYYPTYTIKKWRTGEAVLTGSLIKIDDHKIYSSDFAIGARENTGFGTGQKPEKLIKLLFDASINYNLQPKPIILDFFLGSGTTISVAQKLGLKWIGIEMSDTYFGELFTQIDRYGHILKGVGCLGRMKIVLYGKGGIRTEPTMLSKELGWQGGGFFKYQILEQYEDTLDNIELKENKQMQELFKDEYLLKYFLDFETKESPYLLNIEHLKNPFSYKLKVNLQEVGEPQEMVVDIPETFNYLLGIKIKKVKTEEDKNNNGKKYLFILGEKEQKDIVIVWREYSDNWKEEDFKKDKEFIIKELEIWKPHIVYINGQSVLTPKNWEVRYIEPEFKKLMEG